METKISLAVEFVIKECERENNNFKRNIDKFQISAEN